MNVASLSLLATIQGAWQACLACDGMCLKALCACAGVTYGCLAGLKGTAMVPEGGDFIFSQALLPRSALARQPRGAADMLHVNSFDVKYREDGSVDQFVSDLSVFDGQGREQLRKSISVNDPLRYQVPYPCMRPCHSLSKGDQCLILSIHIKAMTPHHLPEQNTRQLQI